MPDKQAIQEKNLEFAQKMYSASLNKLDKIYDLKSKRKISSEQIQSYLNNPYTNTTNLQNATEYLINMNGILKEIINYKSNILTLDHYLLCADISKYKDKTKFDKAYYKAACELKKFNVKFNVRWMLEKLIQDGETYIYILEDKENVTMMPIPTDFCKITSAKGGVQNYSININKLNDDNIVTFPKDIQKIYDKKKKGTIKNDKNYNSKDNFYELDKTKAFAFSLKYLVPKNIPYYTSILKDLCRLNDLADLQQTSAEIDNFKLLQIVFPYDKDTGEVLVDSETAQLCLDDVDDALPPGIECVGLPYALNSITLGDTKSKDIDYVNKLSNSAFNGAGISSELFNSQKSNNQAVIFGGILDGLLSLKLLEQFRLFFNEYFKNNSNLKNFEIYFVDSTYFNKDAKLQSTINQAATYTCKLELLAYKGLDPYQAYGTIKQEELMGLNNLMLPMSNAHTESSSDIKGEVGEGRSTSQEESGDINKGAEATN